ncbi:MAG: c-type cytochrome domain-containing protein [Planctomycetaceae bacterium]
MREPSRSVRFLLLLAVLLGCVRTVCADVTPEQSETLRQLKRDLSKVTSLLRRKSFDEVATLLDDADAKLQEIMAAADIPESSRKLLGLPQLIANRRKALELQRRKAEGRAAGERVSFKEDVAPLIVEHCLECHGSNNPRAGLNLSTFTGWKRGGVGGPLLAPGAAAGSRLIARLTSTDDKTRMPRDREPLPRPSVETIAQWINQGARFDGDEESTPLTELTKPRPESDVPQPQGTETVSFTQDIAPFVVQLCLRCHSGETPRGGLSLVSFADMLAGGESGPVILPGNREESRLFRLVGGLENPRMPQGRARITRKNYEDLVTWFDEGNVFDGDDPHAPLTSYVPTAEQVAAERFAAMPPDEWLTHRRERTEEIWKRSLPSAPHQSLESVEFLLIGDVSTERLQQIGVWADEHLRTLRRTFDEKSEPVQSPVWKGKLAIMVFHERFGLAEYFISVRDRQNSDRLFGDSVVTPTFSDAYIVLLDVGDEPTELQPGSPAALREVLTAAFISRQAKLPEWLSRGTGLYLAHQADRTNPYLKNLPGRAEKTLSSMNKRADLLADGTFAPADVGPVGFLLVQFLVERTSSTKLAELVRTLQQGTTLAEALSAVTGSDLPAFKQTFLDAVKSGR